MFRFTSINWRHSCKSMFTLNDITLLLTYSYVKAFGFFTVKDLNDMHDLQDQGRFKLL